MDTNTGQIRTLTEGESPQLGEVALGNLHNPNCSKCYGKGHLGMNTITGKYIPCKCTNPKSLPGMKEEVNEFVQSVLSGKYPSFSKYYKGTKRG